MRKQNDSDNDDQIIIPHLKKGGKQWESGSGGLKKEAEMDERKKSTFTQ